MTDLNKLRSEFETLPEVKQWIERLIYGDNSEVYIPIDETEENNAIATWINGAWFVWKLKAKAQGVPVWVSTEFMLPDEGEAVLFIDKDNVIHDGYLNTDYVDGPYGENGEDFGDDQTLWASNSNGDEFLLREIKYWTHRPSSPSASESGAEG
ncbi:hypothetical protein [Acinetobacter pittii]|uniref:hypothetical protein n=1 Tax=Acinetobacter pittii TaxID=48296 RepID=UPI001F2E1D6A|nr:hypothetical protein [Acinetobacter pittii]